MHAIMVNDSLSFLDMILKPWVIWNTTFHELPRSFKRVALGSWGLSAAFFAALVVGGVKYDEIIDWGKVPPKEEEAEHQLACSAVCRPNESKSMEEALNDFADKAAIGTDEDKEKLLAEKRQNSINCVIIGFMPHRENDFHALVLAGEPEGKLRWIGMVSTGIPDDVRLMLNKEMRRMLRSTPVVRCNLEAFWIDPKLKCTVKFEDWSSNKRMVNPGFDKLLVEPKQQAVKPPVASGDQPPASWRESNRSSSAADFAVLVTARSQLSSNTASTAAASSRFGARPTDESAPATGSCTTNSLTGGQLRLPRSTQSHHRTKRWQISQLARSELSGG